MKVLVACEESQAVTIELRKLVHEAYSCDIEPCSGGHEEWHIQSDVLPLLNGNCTFHTVDGINHNIVGRWDMIIAFPPCTYLTVAGNRWFNVEKYGDSAIKKVGEREKGKQFFMQFVNADCERIAIENPVGIMSTEYRKPDQIIQPWMFGHNASKGTCLWLKNLEKLKATDVLQDKEKRKENQRVNLDGKLMGFNTKDENGKILRYNDPKTAKIRSKTFPRIAKAMAEQWGKIEGGNEVGIIDSIKKDANKTGTKIQSSDAQTLETLFNKMFYLSKKVDEETEFVHQVMTRGTEETERKGLHASALIVSDKQFCIRQQVLSLVYKQLQGEQLPVGTMRIFEEGNAIHEKWQRLFLRAGYSKPKLLDKTRVDPQYQVSYTPDIICKIPEFYNGLMVGEIKSVNPFTFKNMMSHPTAKKQLQFYMYLCQKAKGTLDNPDDPDYKKGFVLCDDKGTQDFKVFVYDFDIKEVADFVARCEEVEYCYNRLIESGKMVDRHSECTSRLCDMAGKCPMRDACYNCGMGRVKL